MATKDGGSAFPRAYVSTGEPGMSLRDWFAGQAVNGLMIDRPIGEPVATVAEQAYELADAMLKERVK